MQKYKILDYDGFETVIEADGYVTDKRILTLYRKTGEYSDRPIFSSADWVSVKEIE